ncbi:winged helix-turn-helix transcriptional regulator [Planomonospora sp. ID67723]|uniref:MarR family winged helix-turn-helix transcriptional regulator n=1 Tax=Planomonospora sp. ID67723 TaxID=2738134 RepID=UPI0018C3E9F7|nr:MarR family winged helix-turn-helix transcriptional regulator [Planomonospora sp. ID67723]MBG0831342.1 winged helix-turn-helix transcriptional regulator [Planomonospora sp. ID67723]
MESLTASGLMFSELVIEVFRANGVLLAAGDELARPAGLTSARWQVLGVVEHGPSTIAQVARTMGLTRQSVRQSAESLAADGFVAFEDNPGDRRARLMRLTSKGHEALAYVERHQAEWANRIAERVPPGEMEGAIEALRRIRALLDVQAPSHSRNQEKEAAWPTR